MPLPRPQRRPHQLAVRGLVGRVGVDEFLPGLPVAEQVHPQSGQLLPPSLGPLLVARVGQQLADAECGGGEAGGGVPGAQRGDAGPLELLDVGVHGVAREQGHPAAGQHDRVLMPERLSGVVGGLTQVSRAGPRAQMRPQRVDDLLAQQRVPVGERE